MNTFNKYGKSEADGRSFLEAMNREYIKTQARSCYLVIYIERL